MPLETGIQMTLKFLDSVALAIASFPGMTVALRNQLERQDGSSRSLTSFEMTNQNLSASENLWRVLIEPLSRPGVDSRATATYI
jgi:hypothetical protein